MRYQPLPSNFYIQNREQLTALMTPDSVAVFLSNDIYPTNADASYPFKQNNDLFYFTGIDQEETYLIVRKTQSNIESTLFVIKPDPVTTIWVGEKISKETASTISGIEDIRWNSNYESSLREALTQAKTVYVPVNASSINKKITLPPERLKNWCQVEFPAVSIIEEAFHQLRLIKSSLEIDQIRKACLITEKGYVETLRKIRPGIMEYEIEALLASSFISQGSAGFAYEPIVASGSNACVLHYTSNDQACRSGDLLLLDVGAEYGGYASDLTRTIPVNGRFSKRQREVYNAVLAVQRYAISLLSSGVKMKDYNDAIALYLQNQLVELRLLTKSAIRKQSKSKPLYKQYFMHGTSHQLGLDVHDVGGKICDHFEENMVITVEPGIYIKEENIGIRLENDVVIKNNGCVDLMKTIPIEVEEIESIMNESV